MRLAAVLAASMCCALPGASAPAHRQWFVAAGSSGSGTAASPFGAIQAGLDAAHPGDHVVVQPGRYHEALRTRRAGLPDRPITVRTAGAAGSVVVAAAGRALTIEHPYTVVEGLVFDGGYGTDDTLLLTDRASFAVLRNCEVRRSSRDLIDMRSPRHVLIERCLIHHALDATGGRRDAHGIAAGAVRDLTIRDSEIHTFSGDGIQIDPGRTPPGWDRVTVERTRIWLAPLPAGVNGFAAGTVPGENAVDTKASPALPRASLAIRDSEASGFRAGLIGNMAAFNLKEHVRVEVDRVTVVDSEIAFRVRGAPGPNMAGAEVVVTHAAIADVETAFRYEDNLESLRVWDSTIGPNVRRAFQAASSGRTVLDLRNLNIAADALHPAR